MGNGEWGRGMGNGEWGIGNGEWRMANGEWRMENGEWGMGNGEWGMGNGEWRSEFEVLACTTYRNNYCQSLRQIEYQIVRKFAKCTPQKFSQIQQ